MPGLASLIATGFECGYGLHGATETLQPLQPQQTLHTNLAALESFLVSDN